MKIPKIIHQTWKDDNIPNSLKFCADSWKNMNPDWQYKLWTDNDARDWISKNYPQLLNIYNAFPHPCHSADVFRYLLLNKMGGVYADLDMECLKPLDHFFSTHVKYGEFVLGLEPNLHAKWWGMGSITGNAFIASVPNHPLWGRIINESTKRGELLIAKKDLPEWKMRVGPQMLQECLKDGGDRIDIVPAKILYPIVDLSNRKLSLIARYAAFWMLVNKKFFKESCAVHYWCHITPLEGHRHHMQKIFRICKIISPGKWQAYFE